MTSLYPDNIGPYTSAGEAHQQADATLRDYPPLDTPGQRILMEVLFAAGVRLTAFENSQRATICSQLDLTAVQVIAGWIARAHLGEKHRPDPGDPAGPTAHRRGRYGGSDVGTEEIQQALARADQEALHPMTLHRHGCGHPLAHHDPRTSACRRCPRRPQDDTR